MRHRRPSLIPHCTRQSLRSAAILSQLPASGDGVSHLPALARRLPHASELPRSSRAPTMQPRRVPSPTGRQPDWISTPRSPRSTGGGRELPSSRPHGLAHYGIRVYTSEISSDSFSLRLPCPIGATAECCRLRDTGGESRQHLPRHTPRPSTASKRRPPHAARHIQERTNCCPLPSRPSLGPR